MRSPIASSACDRGADDYVVKPFSPAELVARVGAVLRRVSPPDDEAPPITHGPLRVEPATRRVLLDGEPLSLTMREFDLLAHLAAHPGRVYSRDQLMEAVWREAFFEDTSTVTVHVRRLRAKLGDDPNRASIHRDGLGRRLPVAAMKRAVVIAIAAFFAGAAAVAVPSRMGATQILLVVVAAGAAALATALAVRLAMEERSRARHRGGAPAARRRSLA